MIQWGLFRKYTQFHIDLLNIVISLGIDEIGGG